MRTSREWPAHVWGRIALATGLFVSVALPAERNPAFLLALPPVNALTAQATEQALSWLGIGVHREQATLTHPGGFGYEIVLSCTGVVPAGLLTVAILSAGAPLRSRLQGAVFGVTAVLIANLIRLVSLFCVGVWRPEAFGFAHSVVWEGLTILLLIALFQVWRLHSDRKIVRRPGVLTASVFLGVLTATVCPLDGQVKAAARPFVPGEVIVRFKPNSEAAKLANSSPPGGGQPGAALSSYIGTLSGEIGTPVRVKQLISGGNLVLEIDKTDLSARILERLRTYPNVEQALATPADPAGPGAAPIGIRVEFVEKSAEAAAVNKASAAAREAGPELRAIADSLGKQAGISFITGIVPSRQLLLTVDLETLTLDLVARLRKLADVEYAQPNFIHRPMRRINPGG